MQTQPALSGTPDHVRMAGRVLPFTTIADVAVSYRLALDKSGLRACDDLPECSVYDAAGLELARIGGRRTFAVDPTGRVDYSRCLYDVGADVRGVLQ